MGGRKEGSIVETIQILPFLISIHGDRVPRRNYFPIARDLHPDVQLAAKLVGSMVHIDTERRKALLALFVRNVLDTKDIPHIIPAEMAPSEEILAETTKLIHQKDHVLYVAYEALDLAFDLFKR